MHVTDILARMSETTEYTETGVVTQAECIENFYDSVVEFQHLLDTTPPDDLTTELRSDIISELNEICPFAGEKVYFNGVAVLPAFDTKGKWEADGTMRTTAMGSHNGVAIVPDPENPKRPILMHQAHLKSVPSARGLTLINTASYMAYFDMNSSITLVDELESAFISDESGVPCPASNWDSVLDAYTQDVDHLLRSTPFRRKNRPAQLRILGALVKAAEQETGLQHMPMRLLAGYGYTMLNQGKQKSLIPLSLGHLDVEGACLGFLSIDYLQLRSKAIRKNADRPDELAGICLVIDPSKDTREDLDLASDAMLYIPTGQPIQAEIL